MASGMLTGIFRDLIEIEFGLEAEAIDIIHDNNNIIIDMNTRKLYAGLNSRGQSLESIGGSYSPVTIAIKKSEGQLTDRVTLRDTGDFYEGFYVNASSGMWHLSSNDEKTDELIKQWGSDIFGNTNEDEREFNVEYILPGLIEWILQNLKL